MLTFESLDRCLNPELRTDSEIQLFNYLHSFEGAPQTLTPQTPIPLGVFQKWYEGFLNKIRNDNGAGFLSRED